MPVRLMAQRMPRKKLPEVFLSVTVLVATLPRAVVAAAMHLHRRHLLWSPQHGYTLALWWLLMASVLGTAALWRAQSQALKSRQ